MTKHVENSIKLACKSFEKTIKHFDMRANADNDFLERNLSHHFAKEFAGKSGLVFLEKPFAGHGDKRADKHIDGVALSKSTVVIWETKKLRSKENLEAICADAKRLTDPMLKKDILAKLKSGTHFENWWTNDYGKNAYGKYVKWDEVCIVLTCLNCRKFMSMV